MDNISVLRRAVFGIRRLLLSCFNLPTPSCYVRHQSSAQVHEYDTRSGYMFIEFVENTTGEMLSNTWIEKRGVDELRKSFFRELSRIFLSIARTPLPRIGSFVIDNSGFLHLSNRPLSIEIQELENEGIPTGIQRDYTYSTAQSYAMDILRAHNSRLKHQPNVINDMDDYIYQLSALTSMQTALPSFFTNKLSRGPFALTFTDLNQSNIFVDNKWHITSIVDLEFTCSWPVEMIRTPTWLTNKACDEIAEEADQYDQVRSEFVDILAEEESKNEANSRGISLSTIVRQSWKSGMFWYSLALSSPTGLFAIFYKQIQPIFTRFCTEHDAFQRIMPWYWSPDYPKIAIEKNERQSRIRQPTQ